ncbi:hypothetical protein E2F48_11570 [Arthrobacter crusticola]|uniref:HNH endonuclease n=1 Tax=Arthrobacter crusticola TaxID=2547960 RepID=A0A4R5TXE7_9MICC|nr:hypothetical protein [Arthrobacter crusticola]TDK25853.1 hypothetical protein E2F48_11570 [Arthrobacter crusticola]
MTSRRDDEVTNYWWANQSNNFERVKGTLWTNFFDAKGARRAGSAALGNTRPGDVVFHYDGQFIRTVSIIVSEPAVTYRPPGYQDRESGTEKDDGWLVLVEPLASGLRIDRRKDVSFIEWGGTGPLNKHGGLKRGIYLSPLSESTAEKLLKLAAIDVTAIPETDINSYAEPFSGADLTETDKLMLAKRRVEQQYLRAVLLEESPLRCSMCQREMPESLLVAGHIKPRWACSEEERKDFASVAMLICLLGCDSLYERGLIAVNADGEVVRSSRSVTADIDYLLDGLAGNECLQHDDKSAPFFRWHLENTFVA